MLMFSYTYILCCSAKKNGVSIVLNHCVTTLYAMAITRMKKELEEITHKKKKKQQNKNMRPIYVLENYAVLY